MQLIWLIGNRSVREQDIKNISEAEPLRCKVREKLQSTHRKKTCNKSRKENINIRYSKDPEAKLV